MDDHFICCPAGASDGECKCVVVGVVSLDAKRLGFLMAPQDVPEALVGNKVSTADNRASTRAAAVLEKITHITQITRSIVITHTDQPTATPPTRWTLNTHGPRPEPDPSAIFGHEKETCPNTNPLNSQPLRKHTPAVPTVLRSKTRRAEQAPTRFLLKMQGLLSSSNPMMAQAASFDIYYLNAQRVSRRVATLFFFLARWQSLPPSSCPTARPPAQRTRITFPDETIANPTHASRVMHRLFFLLPPRHIPHNRVSSLPPLHQSQIAHRQRPSDLTFSYPNMLTRLSPLQDEKLAIETTLCDETYLAFPSRVTGSFSYVEHMASELFQRCLPAMHTGQTRDAAVVVVWPVAQGLLLLFEEVKALELKKGFNIAATAVTRTASINAILSPVYEIQVPLNPASGPTIAFVSTFLKFAFASSPTFQPGVFCVFEKALNREIVIVCPIHYTTGGSLELQGSLVFPSTYSVFDNDRRFPWQKNRLGEGYEDDRRIFSVQNSHIIVSRMSSICMHRSIEGYLDPHMQSENVQKGCFIWNHDESEEHCDLAKQSAKFRIANTWIHIVTLTTTKLPNAGKNDFVFRGLIGRFPANMFSSVIILVDFAQTKILIDLVAKATNTKQLCPISRFVPDPNYFGNRPEVLTYDAFGDVIPSVVDTHQMIINNWMSIFVHSGFRAEHIFNGFNSNRARELVEFILSHEDLRLISSWLIIANSLGAPPILRASTIQRCSSTSAILVLVTAAAQLVLSQSKRDGQRAATASIIAATNIARSSPSTQSQNASRALNFNAPAAEAEADVPPPLTPAPSTPSKPPATKRVSTSCVMSSLISPHTPTARKGRARREGNRDHWREGGDERRARPRPAKNGRVTGEVISATMARSLQNIAVDTFTLAPTKSFPRRRRSTKRKATP
jgi:hypothetical protein